MLAIIKLNNFSIYQNEFHLSEKKVNSQHFAIILSGRTTSSNQREFLCVSRRIVLLQILVVLFIREFRIFTLPCCAFAISFCVNLKFKQFCSDSRIKFALRRMKMLTFDEFSTFAIDDTHEKSIFFAA